MFLDAIASHNDNVTSLKNRVGNQKKDDRPNLEPYTLVGINS